MLNRGFWEPTLSSVPVRFNHWSASFNSAVNEIPLLPCVTLTAQTISAEMLLYAPSNETRAGNLHDNQHNIGHVGEAQCSCPSPSESRRLLSTRAPSLSPSPSLNRETKCLARNDRFVLQGAAQELVWHNYSSIGHKLWVHYTGFKDKADGTCDEDCRACTVIFQSQNQHFIVAQSLTFI